MIGTILGLKIGQTSCFTKDGKRIPVSKIIAGPCVVVDKRLEEKNHYNAVRVGFGTKKSNLISKPMKNAFKKAGLDEKNLPRFLKEIKVDKDWIEKNENLKTGNLIFVGDVFKEGDLVQITGVSKGKGFAGVVKRHHFAGGPRTHGQSDRERAPGAIGQTTTPGRVYKGKKMAGRMGQDKVTVKNLKVISIDAQKNLLVVSGLVPGGKNNLLIIKKLNA